MANINGINSISNINAESAMPNSTPPAPVNYYQAGFNQNEEQVKQDALAAQTRKEHAYDLMAQSPDKAALIAKTHGIEFTPEMQQLFKNPQLAKLTIDGAKAAKTLGLTNPEAASAFTQSYVSSGGNSIQAFDAIKGMRGEKFAAPPTAGLPQGMMWDEKTGQPVQIPGVTHSQYAKAGVGGDGKLPPGYRMSVNGTAEKIPGLDPSYYRRPGAQKPWEDERLPLALQMEGHALANQGQLVDLSQVTDWTKRANEAIAASQSGTAKDPIPMPTSPVPDTSSLPPSDSIASQAANASGPPLPPDTLPPDPSAAQVFRNAPLPAAADPNLAPLPAAPSHPLPLKPVASGQPGQQYFRGNAVASPPPAQKDFSHIIFQK